MLNWQRWISLLCHNDSAYGLAFKRYFLSDLIFKWQTLRAINGHLATYLDSLKGITLDCHSCW